MSATIILPGSARPVPRAPHSAAKPGLAATLVYLGMGDRERAIDYLERVYAANSEFLVWMGGDSSIIRCDQSPGSLRC
jgi:hypothetical protein